MVESKKNNLSDYIITFAAAFIATSYSPLSFFEVTFEIDKISWIVISLIVSFVLCVKIVPNNIARGCGNKGNLNPRA